MGPTGLQAVRREATRKTHPSRKNKDAARVGHPNEVRGIPPFAKSAKDGAPRHPDEDCSFPGLKIETRGTRSLEFLEKGSELATASR